MFYDAVNRTVRYEEFVDIQDSRKEDNQNKTEKICT